MMSDKAAFLTEVKDDRADLARVLQKHKGIRRTVEDLYPDNAHFIYELLQNAEDKGATEAVFTLEPDCLIFEHNGETFSEDDVWGITDIGEGTKATDKEKIGCFGIGFKAVFAYTDSPKIYSPTFCFQIDQLVLPSELPANPALGDWTRFEFPFSSEKKTPEDAYQEIETRLDELSKLTLLFLSCLEKIRWGNTTVRRVQHSSTHFEARKEVNNTTTEAKHFLRFSELVDGLESQYVRVAFPLSFLKGATTFDPKKPLSQQMEIVAADPGIVAVSFPAEKETSGLRFHVHAPFIPELSRASVKETVANEPLFDQLAKLTGSSLHVIRDSQLLTAEFLAVLPNQREHLPGRYEIIRDAIIEAMNEEALTPTFVKDHAPAKQLLQSRASLKSLLNELDIRFLVGEDDGERKAWAVGASQRNSLQDHFLSSLDILEWGIEELVDLLNSKASKDWWHEPDEDFLDWLRSKPDEWLQVLYATLYSELESDDTFDDFGSLFIVRRSDDKLGQANESYFPSDGVQHDSMFPRVKESVYTSGKSKKQKDAAKKFLEEIGVRHVGETEEVEAILKARYDGNVDPKKRDLKRFIELVENEPKKATLFKNYHVFECEDGEWAKPSQVYLDSPFQRTGLSAYYQALGEDAQRFPLAPRYQKLGIGIKRIAKFAAALGAQAKLLPEETSCIQNPLWNHLSMVSGERYTSSGIDRDFKIYRLAELLEKPSIDLSRLIWNTMCSLPSYPNYLKACYQKNRANGARNVSSQLVHTLTKTGWVPQTDGSFVKPQDASAELLPEGFPFDSGQAWLKSVEFACGDEKRKEQRRKQQATAATLGISVEDIEFIRNHSKAFEQLKRSVERAAANREAIENSQAGNRERRRMKLKQRRKEAPLKQSVKKLRSVPAYSRSEIDRHALFAYYYDDDEDVPFCQMCFDTMPFVKRNGEESVECIDLFSKDWAEWANFELKVMTPLNVVLCPVCSEIYRDYVQKSVETQEVLYQHFMNNGESEFKVCDDNVRRDGKDNTLKFNQKHLADIRDCLEQLDDDSEDTEGL